MTGQIVLRSAVKINGLSSWSGEKVAPPTAAGDRSQIQSLPSSSWSFQRIRSFGETVVTLRAELDSRWCLKFPEVKIADLDSMRVVTLPSESTQYTTLRKVQCSCRRL
jgi:hypothetical protein